MSYRQAQHFLNVTVVSSKYRDIFHQHVGDEQNLANSIHIWRLDVRAEALELHEKSRAA